MYRGATVGFCFRDSSTLARKVRIGFITSIDGSGNASVFPLWVTGDQISGGAPPNQVNNVPKSAKDFDDDPARIAAGTTCWFRP